MFCCRYAEPTGLLIDSAMNLLVTFIPELSADERREALQRASNYALMRGVTTVVDFGRYLPGSSLEPPWEDFSGFFENWSSVCCQSQFFEIFHLLAYQVLPVYRKELLLPFTKVMVASHLEPTSFIQEKTKILVYGVL